MKKGFTLIELIIVISIIVILLGILLTSFQGVKRTSRDTQRKADLEQIRAALEIYRADCSLYPPTASVVFGQPLNGTGVPPSPCSGTYMSLVPQDTLLPTYQYRYNRTDNSTYFLCAYLETGAVSTGCSLTCGGNCGTVACNYAVCNP